KLAAIPATVATLGHRRVKPSVCFRPNAQATSSRPAAIRYTQAMAPPHGGIVRPSVRYGWRCRVGGGRRGGLAVVDAVRPRPPWPWVRGLSAWRRAAHPYCPVATPVRTGKDSVHAYVY